MASAPNSDANKPVFNTELAQESRQIQDTGVAPDSRAIFKWIREQVQAERATVAQQTVAQPPVTPALALKRARITVDLTEEEIHSECASFSVANTSDPIIAINALCKVITDKQYSGTVSAHNKVIAASCIQTLIAELL